VTLLVAVLVLGGTIAAAPFMKTNFLGDSGQNTFTITQQVGQAPASTPRMPPRRRSRPR
jgi:HAE1 family hydrophobic/amphiphilic exporter-1